MPQMAPMNWLTLFFYFTLIFLLFNSLNYFSFYYHHNKKSIMKTLTFKKNSWKW